MSGPLRPSRTTFAVLVGGVALAVLSVALIVSVAPRQRPVTSASPSLSDAALIDLDRLAANGLLGQIGTPPFETLRDDVLAQARRAMQRDPRPGPLPDALGDLRDDGKAALALAVSFVLAGDPRHGRGAADYIDAWAAEATLDRVCLVSECDRAWRIARDLPAFVFAADLVRDSPAMTQERTDRFADWVVAIRPATPLAVDHEGDAEVLTRIVVGAYLDDATILDAAADVWKARLAVIGSDGRLSTVAAAESPIAATQEALTYRLVAARIAEDRGRALLTATGSSGASIRTAVDRLAADWADPTAWPGTSRPPAGPVWEVAYALWPDPRYLPMLTEYRSSGGGDLVAFRWSTLIEAGVTTAVLPSFDGGASAMPATPRPTTPPVAATTPTPTVTSTPVPGPLAETPAIEFLPGAVRSDVARVRLAWPTGQRADGDRSALSYRLDAAVGDDAYRRLSQGSRRRAEATLAPGSRHRLRLRASTVAAGAGPWSAPLNVGLRRYEERHRAITTAGTWSSAAAGAYSGGRARYSTDPGATLTMDFHGRAVAVRGPVGPTRGEVDVIVDGKSVGRIDLGADDFSGSVVVFEHAWATDGDHRIRLRVVGTSGRRMVAIDAIDVLDGGG